MNRSRALLSIVMLVLVGGRLDAQLQIKLVNPDEPKSLAVEVKGLSDKDLFEISSADQAKLAGFFRLYVKSNYDAGSRQAVLSNVTWQERKIALTPRYPLERGIHYLAQFQCDADQPALSIEFSLPKPDIKPNTQVAAIYPTADTLPQNLLKFYLHFSAPMAQGDVYQYIQLTTADGKVVPYPFLEIEEELWDQSGKRLTLLLDPGRVKRGLVPREEDGPILVAGMQYQLTIKSDWLDAQGANLVKSYVKKFRVGPEDFTQPDPANWRLSPPKSRTREPLIFEIPEAIDHATFMRGVTIENGQGQIVRGEFTFSQHETRAQFRPLKEWKSGLFDVRISTLIEDLAGNSIGRAFEVDRFDQFTPAAIDRKTVTIEIQ